MNLKIAVIDSTVADVIIRIPHFPRSHILHQQMALGGCAYNVAQLLALFQASYGFLFFY